MCFEFMTSYAPPYALRVITVSFGTVASQYAYSSLAPCLMMPPCSCATPGRKPGTSSKVTSGTLNASQNRMKRAPLADAALSSTPASTAGWLAITPTGRPPSRAKPTSRLPPKSRCTSKKPPPSTTRLMTSCMSYGVLALSGTTSSRSSSRRSGGSSDGWIGAPSRLLEGRYDSRVRIAASDSSSESCTKCATPEVAPCTSAPPSCSKSTSSCVTVFTTLGPVTNIYETPRTMNTKSVMAGLYTAPPAQGPSTALICGTTPEASVLRRKISAYPPSDATPSWIRAPPESLRPIIGAPVFTARSITLQIFSACALVSDPPNTVKSCANTNTWRPSIRPCPVTTPSPRYFSSARPKSLERCVTNRSSSTKEPRSSSASSRSRAVSLPLSCWAWIRSAPPPSSAWARFC